MCDRGARVAFEGVQSACYRKCETTNRRTGAVHLFFDRVAIEAAGERIRQRPFHLLDCQEPGAEYEGKFYPRDSLPRFNCD